MARQVQTIGERSGLRRALDSISPAGHNQRVSAADSGPDDASFEAVPFPEDARFICGSRRTFGSRVPPAYRPFRLSPGGPAEAATLPDTLSGVRREGRCLSGSSRPVSRDNFGSCSVRDRTVSLVARRMAASQGFPWLPRERSWNRTSNLQSQKLSLYC